MGDTIWDWSTTAANNATADTSINWSEGQLPSTVNNSAREMMAKIAYMLRDFSSSLTTGGTGDAYTVSPGKAPTSLSDGWIAVVRFDRANTGAATFQVGSLTAADLVDAEGNALAAGDIVAGGIYIVAYNPTSADFHLVNRIPLHSGEVGTTQIADLAVTTAKLAASSVTTAKIADANVTPAKLDSTGAYTVDSLTATTTLLRGSSIIWGDDNFAARIAALTANASPAGTESVACDDGQRVTLQDIADLAGGGSLTVGSGYIQTSDGLIIQSTSFDTTSYSSSITITYPIAFPNAVIGGSISPVQGSSTAYAAVGEKSIAWGSSSVTITYSDTVEIVGTNEIHIIVFGY